MASWMTIENRALESGLFQLTPEELATALYWELPIGVTQLFNLIHCHCYQASLPSTLVNRHTRIPSSLMNAFPCAAFTLNDNCEESEEPTQARAIADTIDHEEELPHPRIYLPPGIDVHLSTDAAAEVVARLPEDWAITDHGHWPSFSAHC
eukprot:s128_g13.t1